MTPLGDNITLLQTFGGNVFEHIQGLMTPVFVGYTAFVQAPST